MNEVPYKNRELDEKFKGLGEKVDNGILHISDRVAGFETDTRNSLQRIESKQDFTNGKVKRITISLVALGAFSIGTGLTNSSAALSLIRLLIGI